MTMKSIRGSFLQIKIDVFHYLGKKLVTVLIKTKVDDRHNRDLLRSTWLADIQQYNLQYSFLIGKYINSNRKCNNKFF